jgi:type I restriction enzyme M protein
VPGITQQQLESRLWEAANSLRGPVDPADFKAYVFPLLFFKWISDTWDLEHAEAVADYGPGVSAEEEADYHRFVVPAGCRWADVASSTTNVGRKLRLTLGRIEQANPTTLAGVFGNVDWVDKERLPEANLVNLLNAFTPLTLNRSNVPNDMLGAAYE